MHPLRNGVSMKLRVHSEFGTDTAVSFHFAYLRLTNNHRKKLEPEVEKVFNTHAHFDSAVGHFTDVTDDVSTTQLIAPWDGGTGIHFPLTPFLLLT
jgi:hypothetical protein